jgi:hypothetical protein
MTFKDAGAFYVYSHIDPDTKEIKYIGIGQYDRACSVRTNNRKEKHYDWLKKQYDKGYTLADIVVIVQKGLTKKDALEIEMLKIKQLKPMLNELSNPDHWQRGRKQTEDTSLFAKALYEMGYGYKRIAHLMGGTKNNHMSIKRMLSYV